MMNWKNAKLNPMFVFDYLYYMSILISSQIQAISLVYTGDWGWCKGQRSSCYRSKVMKRSKFTCPRLITAIYSFETSLSTGG